MELTLSSLREAAAEGKNVMSYILDAVRAYATVGEIVGTLKHIYGEAQPVRAI